MVVAIEESILLLIVGLFSGLFIPLFVFLIKMIMRVSELESKVNSFVNGQKEMREQGVSIGDIKSDVRILKLRMDNAEVEIRGTQGAPNIDYDGVRDVYKRDEGNKKK